MHMEIFTSQKRKHKLLKFDEKTEESRFNTILKFNFLLLYSRFTISKFKGKSLSRSQDTVAQYWFVKQKMAIYRKIGNFPMMMFSNRKMAAGSFDIQHVLLPCLWASQFIFKGAKKKNWFSGNAGANKAHLQLKKQGKCLTGEVGRKVTNRSPVTGQSSFLIKICPKIRINAPMTFKLK